MNKDEVLTIEHYKEPLISLEDKGKGFGYLGALSITTDGEKVQCHVCGKLYSCLYSHARQAHKLSAKKYREKFKLSPTTALVSENERIRRKERTIKWLQGLTPEERREIKASATKGRKNRRNYQPKLSLETKNKRGICPDQLIQKILDVSEKLGKTPTLAEFIDETGGQRFKHLIFATFGSWNRAVKKAGLDINNKSPGPSKKPRLSDEELLEYLAIYTEEHQQIPTATDSKRKLIPSYDIYTRRFGSFDKAREMAGCYDILERLNPEGLEQFIIRSSLAS